MHALFIWVETTAFSTWLRESPSLFAFPAVLTLHTVGLAFLVGINAVIDLRILGFAPGTPLAALESFCRIVWYGFWVNAASGVLLLVAYPAKSLTNPLFYVKLILIAGGMATFQKIRNVVFRGRNLEVAPVSRRDRRLAGSSLVVWTAAITTGRLLAYTYKHLLIYAE